MKTTFKAIIVEKSIDKLFSISIKDKSIDNLPDGDLLIKVNYSSLNYKDALSSAGNIGVTKKYPHTPGIDAVGFIEISKNENFKIGQEVIVSGYDLGMNTPGGFGEYIRVPSSWACRLPENLTAIESMKVFLTLLIISFDIYSAPIKDTIQLLLFYLFKDSFKCLEALKYG